MLALQSACRQRPSDFARLDIDDKIGELSHTRSKHSLKNLDQKSGVATLTCSSSNTIAYVNTEAISAGCNANMLKLKRDDRADDRPDALPLQR